MTIRHLKVFSQVCLTGSFTKAGEQLNMAQPAISSMIKELELYYHVRLFDRMNRKIYLTDAGHLLETYANSILSQLNEAKEILQTTEARSKVRIGSNVAFGIDYLPKILAEFSHLHPEIPVYTKIENSAAIEQALLLNNLDFAIMDNFSSMDCFHSQLLFSDQTKLLASPSFIRKHFPLLNSSSVSGKKNSSIKLSQLSELPFLLRESGSGSREIIERLMRQLGTSPWIVAESTSTQSLIELCKYGHGLILLPSVPAHSTISSGELVEIPLANVTLERNYYLVNHNSKYLTKSMQYFLDMIMSLKMI